jgi:hypothetical protein
MPVKMPLKALCIAATLALLPGCATWSSTSVDNKASSAANSPTDPAKVMLSEKDMTNRKYTSLGDVSVTVNKTTIFNKDPTRDDVNAKLREEAAKLGADAVILVRYGDGGVSMMSWGSLEGRGRAIKYQ